MLARKCPVCGTDELKRLPAQPTMEVYRCELGHLFIISFVRHASEDPTPKPS
jgi:hypothetical protein